MANHQKHSYEIHIQICIRVEWTCNWLSNNISRSGVWEVLTGEAQLKEEVLLGSCLESPKGTNLRMVKFKSYSLNSRFKKCYSYTVNIITPFLAGN